MSTKVEYGIQDKYGRWMTERRTFSVINNAYRFPTYRAALNVAIKMNWNASKDMPYNSRRRRSKYEVKAILATT